MANKKDQYPMTDKMIRTFNKETRVLEWVGGCTYYITVKGNRLRSSDLDELQKMFIAAIYDLPIPKRKHTLLTSSKI